MVVPIHGLSAQETAYVDSRLDAEGEKAMTTFTFNELYIYWIMKINILLASPKQRKAYDEFFQSEVAPFLTEALERYERQFHPEISGSIGKACQ